MPDSTNRGDLNWPKGDKSAYAASVAREAGLETLAASSELVPARRMKAIAAVIDVSLDLGDEQVVITAAGQLNGSTKHVLEDALEVIFRRRPAGIQLDASRLTCSSPASLEPLIEAAWHCRRLSIPLRLMLSTEMRKLFDSVRLAWFGVVEDGPSMDIALIAALKRARNGFASGQSDH